MTTTGEVVGYLDYLMNNGEIYFPYTRVEGIFDQYGNPFSDWIANMNTHNHDGKYSLIDHNHDTKYATKDHEHGNYSLLDHTHNYAGSNSVGGAAITALALNKEFTLNVTGSETGSVSIKGDSNVTLNLSVNHTHDIYLTNNTNNIITAGDGVDKPLSIVADGGTAQIELYNTSSSDKSYIKFTDGALILGYNNIPLKITTVGVYYNGKLLATTDDITNTGGGVAEGHTHTISDITDFPGSMPNPYKAIFSMSGGINYEYDGSSEITIPMDPTSLGCASFDHNHDYTYSALNHTHMEAYLALNGSNEYTGSYIAIKNFEPSEYTEDGSIPTEPVTMVKGLRFSDDNYGSSVIGATYKYSVDDSMSYLTELFMRLGSSTSTQSKLSVKSDGIYYNDNKMLDVGMYGHNNGINADMLDGYHADGLPYIKGTEDVIYLGKDTKSKIMIDVSGTSATDINIRNAAGYILNMNVSENGTDIILTISSGGTDMLTITRDKSTNQIRTDLYGTIYVNGTQLSV